MVFVLTCMSSEKKENRDGGRVERAARRERGVEAEIPVVLEEVGGEIPASSSRPPLSHH